MKLFRKYEEKGNIIEEYIGGDTALYTLDDGTKISARIECLKSYNNVPQVTQPTLEEMQTQTLLNTEYLVIMSELTNM